MPSKKNNSGSSKNDNKQMQDQKMSHMKSEESGYSQNQGKKKQ